MPIARLCQVRRSSFAPALGLPESSSSPGHPGPPPRQRLLSRPQPAARRPSQGLMVPGRALALDSIQIEPPPCAMAVELSANLTAVAPMRVRIGGQSIALFRGLDGQIAALADICPHRGASLSRGQVVSGSLLCPNHGRHYTADGSCTEVASLRAQSYIFEEQHGRIWTRDPRLGASPTAAIPFAQQLEDTTFFSIEGVAPVRAAWQLIYENSTDILHLDAVHGLPAVVSAIVQPDAYTDIFLYEGIKGSPLKGVVTALMPLLGLSGKRIVTITKRPPTSVMVTIHEVDQASIFRIIINAAEDGQQENGNPCAKTIWSFSHNISWLGHHFDFILRQIMESNLREDNEVLEGMHRPTYNQRQKS